MGGDYIREDVVTAKIYSGDITLAKSCQRHLLKKSIGG